MIEKHQILIDGLVKIAKNVCNPQEVATVTLQTYMGVNNMELAERSFLPGYHEYITAFSYDIRHGYEFIEYSLPKNILKLPYAAILSENYKYTHAVTSINETETHLIIQIDKL